MSAQEGMSLSGYGVRLWCSAGVAVGRGAGLVIERLRVPIPAGMAGEFSSPESALRADSYSVFIPPPVLLQWHVKDPGHSAKSTGGRLHLKTCIHP